MNAQEKHNSDVATCRACLLADRMKPCRSGCHCRFEVGLEQTYAEFTDKLKQYAPRPFVPKANCEHKNEYATLKGMFCRDCHRVREAVTDLEKRFVSRLAPRTNGYVNYGMR